MEWSRGHTIGHGSSGTVSIATRRDGCRVFAVKSSELCNSESLQREQRILSSLCSPYVVNFKGSDITMENNKLYYNLFMEYMPFGTLSSEINRHGGRLDEAKIKTYTRQIVQGLEYIHSKGLVHCDIKCSNILIGTEGAKIGDLGCAKSVVDPRISGTPMLMAPEAVRGEDQGCASDIWSLGCTIIEMAKGEAAWPNLLDPFCVLYHIAYSGEVPEIPWFLSEEGKDFLGKCLRWNPEERCTATQLLNHPFLGEFNSKVESNSTSPTSILEHGFWSCVEEGSHTTRTTSLGDLPPDRVRMLGLCSEESCWASWNDDDDDGNWITIRRNECDSWGEGVFGNFGSETASSSNGGLDLKELVESNVSGRNCSKQ
ncbi:hypothetical protein HN51_035087 [Arachis hypogaea]|uniref:mitogen-activated protein kinase kinase kinase A-like n=1 Tax=Arachis ipaensis TaxID=130454 RepID=UPI0007AF8135|nr:mitogen-activated protein kinase kinase kinase A-like [Arachis ipaensis]XP_025643230.1 mitogen-activated protein kinase kinase kinase 18 [Arachis hypogaea]QHO00058.1 uncharacterized protein DS421_13g403160 [Arachis hypogaea]